MPTAKAGTKLNIPITPDVMNTPFNTVIYTGVGVIGLVSGVIQKVGLKMRLMTIKVITEPTVSNPEMISKANASFLFDFVLSLLIR